MTKFSETERNALKTAKFVGDTVIDRLEQIGIADCKTLATKSVDEICEMVAMHLNTSCWKNSHQAKAAIGNAIAVAKTFS